MEDVLDVLGSFVECILDKEVRNDNEGELISIDVFQSGIGANNGRLILATDCRADSVTMFQCSVECRKADEASGSSEKNEVARHGEVLSQRAVLY